MIWIPMIYWSSLILQKKDPKCLKIDSQPWRWIEGKCTSGSRFWLAYLPGDKYLPSHTNRIRHFISSLHFFDGWRLMVPFFTQQKGEGWLTSLLCYSLFYLSVPLITSWDLIVRAPQGYCQSPTFLQSFTASPTTRNKRWILSAPISSPGQTEMYLWRYCGNLSQPDIEWWSMAHGVSINLNSYQLWWL